MSSENNLFIEESVLSPLMELIEILSAHQDIHSLTSSHTLLDYKKELQNPLENCFGNDHLIYKNFLNEVTCCACRAVLCDWELACHHHFCFRCIKAKTFILSKSVDELYEDIDEFPKCPVCMKTISKKIAENVVAAAKTGNKLKELGNFKRCLKCHLLRDSKKFLFTCDDICIFCGLHIVQSNEKCIFCGEESMKPEMMKYSEGVRCSVCSKVKNVTENLCTEICCQSIHCYDCLRLAWSASSCQKCGSDLDVETLTYLNALLFSECQSCGNTSEAAFMVKKTCCSERICMFCQKSKEKVCKNCGSRLKPPVVKMLGRIVDSSS